MTLEKINPEQIMSPVNQAYHHVVIAPSNGRSAYISGQVGMRKDGTIPDEVRAQAELAWQNLVACLESAHMFPQDVVKVTAYLIDHEDYGFFSEMRNKYLGRSRPASTVVLVKSLVLPELKVEIEAIAVQQTA